MANVPIRYGIEGDREVEEAFRRLDAAAGRFGESLLKAGEQGAGGTKQITEALGEVEKAFEQAAQTAQKSADDIANGAKRGGSAAKDFAKEAGDLGKTIGSGLATALTAGITAMTAYAEKGVETASRLKDLQEQTQINVEALQAWEAGFGRAGVSTKSLTDGLLQLTRVTGQAAEGSERAEKAFGAVGTSVYDLSGRLKSGEQVFRDVVEGLSRLPSAQERAAAGARLLGQAWKDIAPNVEAGAATLRQFEEEARRAGRIVGSDQINELDKLKKEWDGLWNHATAGAMRFAENLAPAMRRATAVISNALAIEVRPAETLKVVELANNVARIENNLRDLEKTRPGWLMTPGGIAAAEVARVEITRLNDQIERLLELQRVAAAQQMRAVDREEMLRQYGRELGNDNESLIPGFGNPARNARLAPREVPVRSTGGGHGTDPRKGYEDAKKALDDYLASLDREVELSRLSDRQRAIATAGLKAEKLAQDEINAAKKAGIQIDEEAVRREARQRAESAAAQNYDIDKAKRESERQREQAVQAELRRWERAADRMQDVFADAIYKGLRDGSLRAGDIWRSVGDLARRQIAESLAAGITLPIRAVFGQMLGSGIGGPAGANGPGAAGGAGGGLLGNPFGALMPRGGFGFLSQPIWGGDTAAAYNGVIENVSGAEAARYFNGWSSVGPSWGQGLGSLAMAGGGIYQMTRGGTGNLIAGGSAIAGAGLDLILPGAGTALAMAGQIFGAILGNDTPSPQAAANILFDRTAAPWNYATSALAQERDGGNATGVTTGANSIATQINRTLWRIGATPGAGFQSGYILNSQGNNTGDQWIVGTGAYGTDSATEIASGLGGEQAVARLLNETFTRAAQNGQLRQGVSSAWSQTIVTALQHIDVEDQNAIEQAISTSRAYDELLETGRAGDQVRDQLEQLGEQFHALEFEAARLGLGLDELHAAETRATRALYDDFGTGISDTLLGLTDPKALELLRIDRWVEQQLAAVQAYVEEGVATVAEGEARKLEIQQIAAEQQAAVQERYAAQSVNGLQDLYRRLVYGDLSGASPTTALQGASAAFRSAFAAATAEGASAADVQQFMAAAQQYGALNLQTHGIGGDFRSIQETITSATAAVIASQGGSLPAVGGLAGYIPTTSGGAVDAGEINALIFKVADLIDQITLLRAQLPAA